MSALGWLAFAMAAGLATAIVAGALRARAYALVFVLLYLCHLTLPRQILLLSGLSPPIPSTHWGAFLSFLVMADLALIVWLASMLASYVALHPVGGALGLAFPRATRPRADRLWLAALGLTALATAISAVLILRAGSVAGFMFSVKVEKGLAGAYALQQVPTLAALTALLAYFAKAERAKEPLAGRAAGRCRRSVPPRAAVPVLALLCWNLALVYMWGNRTVLGLTLLTGAAAYGCHMRRWRLWELAAGIVAAGIVFQVLRVTRDLLLAEAALQDARVLYRGQDVLEHLSLSLHWAQFDGLMLALRDAGEAFDLRYGADFANGLLAWVPRQLWPDKPFTFHVGWWFRRIYEPDRMNGWPVTPLGSWYVNFGAPGIVLGGLATGLFARAIDSAYAHARDDAWAAVLLPTCAFFLADGGVNTGVAQLYVLTIVPLWALAAVAGDGRVRPIRARRHPVAGPVRSSRSGHGAELR